MIIRTHKNILTAYGTIWEGDGKYFESVFSNLESQYSDITIRMHTGGGSVFDGNIMYNVVNKSPKNVDIIIDGIAASMGSVFMLSRQQVKIVENGYVMIHAPSSGNYGNAKDMESEAKLLRLVEKNFISKFQEKTGKSKEEIEKWMDGSDYWFDAQECLAMGLVTEIIPATITTPLPVENPENMDNKKLSAIYASLLTTDISKLKNIKTQIVDMKQPLIQALDLKNVNPQSSDTAVLEAVQNKLSAVEQERDQAIEKLNGIGKTQVKALLDANKDSYPEDKRAVYEAIGETQGIEALTTVLEAISSKKQAPNIKDLITNKDQNEVTAGWTYSDWLDKDPEGLEKMSQDSPEAFEKLAMNEYKDYL